MDIRLLINMEVVNGEGDYEPKVVFWARTDDAPDFYAAADHLKELLQLSQEALDDEFEQPVNFQVQLVQIESTEGSPVRYLQNVEGMTPPLVGRPFVPSESMSRSMAMA